MSNSTPTTEDVDRVLKMKKYLALPMTWSVKDADKRPPQLEYRSAFLSENGSSIEGLMAICQWREYSIIGLCPVVYFGIFFQRHRVFAIDVQHKPHRNRPGVGRGLEFHNQRLEGPHQHIWTGEYGYAEPIEGLSSTEEYWNLFCHKAMIEGNTTFTSPDVDENTGQRRIQF